MSAPPLRQREAQAWRLAARNYADCGTTLETARGPSARRHESRHTVASRALARARNRGGIMTRDEWLETRAALAALLPSRAVTRANDMSGIDYMMQLEHGPCPPEGPHAMLGKWRVTREGGFYVARRGRDELRHACAFQCAEVIGHTSDNDLRALLALSEGEK